MNQENSSFLKICKKCGTEKDIKAFRQKRNTCIDCEHAYNSKYGKEKREQLSLRRKNNRLNNLEKYKEREAAYNKSDARKESLRLWRQKNKERIKEYRQKYYTENNEEIRKKHREKYSEVKENNPEMLSRKAEQTKKWREENPDVVKSYRRKYRLNITDQLTLSYVEHLLSKPCAYCGEKSETLDHIVPLSKGGQHSFDNLVQSCNACNISKSNRSLGEFLVERNMFI